MPWSLGLDPIAGHQVSLASLPTYCGLGGVGHPGLGYPGLSQGTFQGTEGAKGTNPGFSVYPLVGLLVGQPLG